MPFASVRPVRHSRLPVACADGRSVNLYCHLPILLVALPNWLTAEEERSNLRTVCRLVKRCAISGSATAPQIVSVAEPNHEGGTWVDTPSIQSTANAPVIPSSASATGPHALPPTMILVIKPVRIPIASKHQGPSIIANDLLSPKIVNKTLLHQLGWRVAQGPSV